MIYFLSQSVRKMIKDYLFAENKQTNKQQQQQQQTGVSDKVERRKALDQN